MTIKHHKTVACLLALSASLQAQNINSSNQSQTESQDLSNLIVTAGIAPIESDQYGGSVTVITAAHIAQAQANYLSDILRQVPGFAINQSGGPGTQTQLRVRGSEANHVMVLLDGVRVNDPTAGDEFLFNYALLDNIERIEIIRGPQSAIWGTDAMSAVINIISKQSVKNNWGFDLELGSFNSKRIALDGGLAEDNWRLDAGINYLDTAGTNISRQGTEADGFENIASHLRFGVDATDTVSLQIRANHSDALNEFDGIDFAVTGLPVDADLWTKRQQTTVQLVAKFKPNSSWHSDLSYQWSDVDAQNFTFGFGETSSTAAQTDEIKLNSSLQFGTDDQHRLSALVDHRQVDFVQRGEASPFGDPNQRQDYSVTGLAVEYQHQLNQQFNWNVSARQDDFNRFEGVSNYKVAASYHLNAGWRLRGSLGTGSKAPSFIERFGFFPANFIGNPNLVPEESDAFELAVEKTWLNNRLELVYFDQDLDNEINGFVFDVASGLFTAANQMGKSQRQGVEFSWSGQLNDQLDFNFNYTYTDATEEDASGTEVTEVRRPENMAHLGFNYRFAANRASLYAQVNYQDDQLDVFFDPSTFVSSKVNLDGYTTVDLSFSWQLNPTIQLYAKAQNLFDESYQEVLGYARPGAAFYAGIKARF
ncbi:Outer membrane vitamin B12 receptor BtuB [hydrothermal vent metagenome]|uniref:Outer membrane vitamin B12 receptor BtuB n=1 Tax=hydrothermal vent metagenome TaxID=652676 RepID=A0A3B0VK14_9ZZZZ